MTKEEAAFLYSFDPGLECVIQDKKDGFTTGWEAAELYRPFNPLENAKVFGPQEHITLEDRKLINSAKRKCRHFWSREDICETCGVHLAETTR